MCVCASSAVVLCDACACCGGRLCIPQVDTLKHTLAATLDRGLAESNHVVARAQETLGRVNLARQRAAAASRRNKVQITNYPSTPHLPFSPTVHSDDIQVSWSVIRKANEQIMPTKGF